MEDAWIAYRRAQGCLPVYLVVRDRKNQASLAVGVMYEKRPLWRPWLKAELFLDRAPWDLTSVSQTGSILASLVRLAKAEDYRRLALHSFDGPSPPPDLGALGFEAVERYEFPLDLTQPEEELWQGLKASHRRKVRKAERSGVTVAEESSAAGFGIVRELQGFTQRRRAERGESMECASASQFRLMSRTLLSDGKFMVFVARSGGAPVSAVLIGVGRERAYYLMGGTNAEGLATNAATGLMWQVTRIAQKLGVKCFNLGGVAQAAEVSDHFEHGLHRFKAGFGGERVLCRSGTLELASIERPVNGATRLPQDP